MLATDLMTPETLRMVQAIARTGSMAAAARKLGLVPSALSYRVRQLEESMDVLLFDRSRRQAFLTPAGQELCDRSDQLLAQMNTVVNRVKRIALGWESELTIAVDSIISKTALFEMIEHFEQLKSPTLLRFRSEALSGTMEALTTGEADLSIGTSFITGEHRNIQNKPMGRLEFIFVCAPHHPLAQIEQPLSDSIIEQNRSIAIADTAYGAKHTIGILAGQSAMTVPTLNSKIEGLIRGLGCGFLPKNQVQSYLDSGRLIQKPLERAAFFVDLYYSWRKGGSSQSRPGQALQWWLDALSNPRTQVALANQMGGGL